MDGDSRAPTINKNDIMAKLAALDEDVGEDDQANSNAAEDNNE